MNEDEDKIKKNESEIYESTIKDTAKQIFDKLKFGTGIHNLFNYYPYEENTSKIVELITNECKCKVRLPNGNIKKYESNLPIDTVKDIIMQIISDKNSINKSVISEIMSTEMVRGISCEIPIRKETDSNGKMTLNFEKEVFPNNFENIINSSISDQNVIKNVITPRAVTIIENDEELSKRNKISKLMHPIITKTVGNDKLKERYEAYLRKNYNLSEDQIKNTVNYFIINFLNSCKLEKEIVKDEKQGGFLLQENKTKNGYLGMVENIIYELIDYAKTIKNPNDNLEEIKIIYNNLVGQLVALKTVFPNDKNKIEEQIKEININMNNKRKYCDTKTQYRNVPVGFNGKDVGLLEAKYVPKAMNLFCQSLQEFQNNKDKMEDKEFFKEVAKLHFRFIRIHPFLDGNGRTGRAIVNSLLSERNLCAVIKKTEKKDYLNALNSSANLMPSEYYKSLYTNQKLSSEIEDNFIYKTEEFLGIKCLKRESLYPNVTEKLTENINKESSSKSLETK